MRYGIFSDIHSNLEALDAVLGALKNEAIDRFICVGDLVGYGPDPRLCIQKIRQLGCKIVAGNHDWGVSGKIKTNTFSVCAAEAVNWTKNVISKEDRDFLSALNIEYVNSDLCAVHASYEDPYSFNYLYRASAAVETFKFMPVNVCFIGHTHVPAVFRLNAEKAVMLKQQRVVIAPEMKYIFNAGSVGQPRDGVNLAAFCVFDTKKKLVEFRRIRYNIASVQEKIRKRGLAEIFAVRLGQGR